MDVSLRLADLPAMHPMLLWDVIAAAAVAVLSESMTTSPPCLAFTFENVPDFGNRTVSMSLDVGGVSPTYVNQVRRTYDSARLVELAAIAIAGLGLYHASGHEIRDVAIRGTGADYLVDEKSHLLEIAGRSRRGDFLAAWQQRWQRLLDRDVSGFYVCITEFETPAARLAFHSA